MKIIFVDIDGVLVPERFSTKHVDEFGYAFSNKCVENFNKIIELTGAKLVVSSTWRRVGNSAGVDGMRALWKKRNMSGEIIGITPSMSGLGRHPRAVEIESWLENNKELFIENWVSIDDWEVFDKGSKNYIKHFVRINETTGITNKDVKKVVEKLK